jgi:hypothetical protein
MKGRKKKKGTEDEVETSAPPPGARGRVSSGNNNSPKVNKSCECNQLRQTCKYPKTIRKRKKTETNKKVYNSQIQTILFG